MILKPLQFIYSAAVLLKNNLYDRGLFGKTILKIPVISVGNLSVGGTGKTPCVFYLATAILQQNNQKKIVIVSRSYKGTLKKPQKVDLSLKNAIDLFGDEPCLLQKKLPRCQVWAGPVKNLTAQAAAASDQPDLIIIDDGFSHRKLHRQFDLVLIDATAPMVHMQTLPEGRLREPLSQLNRAQAVVLTKCNLVPAEKVAHLKELIVTKSSVTAENIYTANVISQLNHLNPQSDHLFVFCGLGQPESFRNMLAQLNFTIHEFKMFPDHYQYTEADLSKLVNQFQEEKKLNPRLKLVTTAKDSVKIRDHQIEKIITIVDYEIKIENNKMGSLVEKISQII